MATDNFQASLNLVLKVEGGFVNNPHDPGGATNHGITQGVYDEYRRRLGQGRMPVGTITVGDVTAIYRLQYWQPIQGDQLPLGVDYVVFDSAVNSGVSRAAKWLQLSLPTTPVDGQIGLGTVGAAVGCNDPVALIKRICSRRLGFLHQLRTWLNFGRGWTNRMNTVQAAALAMIK